MRAVPRSHTEPRSANDGRDAFRRRAAAALTHPATLAALVALLVNDIALKRAFPDAWAMGKISDLAWMVFAPPLLAYALSLIAGRSTLGGRAVFGIAYVGLPLLYAAFNTFEPVHSAISRGLALVGGSGPGAPLDPTDSAVIPFAMAAALWVWRRPPLRPGAVRARLALLTMAVAAVATVASSPPRSVEGITNVQADEDGTARASTDFGYTTYESADGGLTWAQGERFDFDEPSMSARTLSGDYYVIVETDVFRVRTGGGKREVVYSAAYLSEGPNAWLHIRETREHGDRELTFEPRAIAYDGASGNVIAAMGMQGVVVIAPDGAWRAVAVGPFEPTDFSVVSKLRELGNFLFLWLAFAFAASFASLGFAPALLARQRGTSEHKCASFLMAVPASLCVFYIVGAGLYPSETLPGHFISIPGNPDFWNLPVGGIVLVVAFAGIAANRPTWRQALAGAASVAGMLLLVLLAFLLWLQVNLSLGYADLFALLFVGLAALALFSYTAYSTRGAAQGDRGEG